MVASAAPGGWPRGALGYCANVHPGADLAALEANVAGPIAAVRRLRGLDRMACGLWLPAPIARALAADPGRLLDWLNAAGLDLITLNGFPQGDFHGERVKEAVYTPAWDSPERLAYTLDLALILAHCLPAGQAEGTISSLPLGWGPDWTPVRQAPALRHLCHLARRLAERKAQTGRHIRVCLEPEPGCVLETTAQAIALFTQALPAAALDLGLDPASLRAHLGICFDICHQAVMFEDIETALARLATAGVCVGKIQVSSALTVPTPDRADLDALLTPFAEPRYLHQVRTLDADGRTLGHMDLDQALADPAFARAKPWRIHYHVPIQQGDLGPGLGTTQAAIGAALDHLAAHPGQRPHLEVETYTWQVLPPKRRPQGAEGLVAGLAAELAWLETQMQARGLLAGVEP